MNCEKARIEIMESVDGQPFDANFLNAHIDECSGCRAYLEEHRLLQTVLPIWEPPVARNNLAPKILQAIYAEASTAETETKTRPAKKWLTVPRMIAAGIVFVLGLSLFIHDGRTPAVGMEKLHHHTTIAASRNEAMVGVVLLTRSSTADSFPFGQ